MTRFLLCRHGNTDAVGRALVGRAPQISLNEQGRAEAQALARHLQSESIAAVHSSPLDRALETAHAIAAHHALDVTVQNRLVDCDFGAWTGKAIAELEQLQEFRRFNTHRSLVRAPGGEHALEIQARMVSTLESLAADFPHATVTLVSHADPLKTLLGHFLGIPIDCLNRLRIDTGSVSVLELGAEHVSVLTINTVPRAAQ